MEDKKQGYKVKEYHGPVKRYCQMLDLKDGDAAFIAEYRKRHAEGNVWPETLAAIREVGILEMELYILGKHVVMIVEFDTLVGGKTAIYISHRLSSCKFCDHIAVFAEDTIKEYGTHETLVKKQDGIYAKMFAAQAQYYVEHAEVAGA